MKFGELRDVLSPGHRIHDRRSRGRRSDLLKLPTTDFIDYIENTKVPADVILVSMDVTSLYTNIPQEEGIHTVCRTYETFYINKPPIPTQPLEQALRLILQQNSLQFNGKNYLETHGTAMGTKMAVAFSDIFMNKVETDILSQSELKPLVWKRFIDDTFSLWTINRDQEP